MKFIFIIILFAISGRSTHAISITSEGINATSSSFLYCPEARAISVHDGKKSVDIVGETSGVGAVVTGVLAP